MNQSPQQNSTLRRFGLYAILHPAQNEHAEIFYEVAYFLQLMDQFINRKALKSCEEKMEFGTQHIWGNLFHITLIGFVPMVDSQVNELKSVLENIEKQTDSESSLSEKVNLVWRKSSDKHEPLWDFRINFENQKLCKVVHEVHDKMDFYKEENNKRRLRLQNNYHGSLLSDVKLSRRDEIVDYLSNYQNIIPTLYKCMINDQDNSIQQMIEQEFKKLTWSLQIVSYEDPKSPLNKWKEHDLFLL